MTANRLTFDQKKQLCDLAEQFKVNDNPLAKCNNEKWLEIAKIMNHGSIKRLYYNLIHRGGNKKTELKLEKLPPIDVEKALSFMKYVEYDQKGAEYYKRPEEDNNGAMDQEINCISLIKDWVCPMCELLSSGDVEPIILCEKCQRWYHMSCLDQIPDELFYCDGCMPF